MKSSQMLEIEQALHAIRLILADRKGDGESAPSFDLTDLNKLLPAGKIPARNVEEDRFASQERAAIRLCLTSTATLLDVVRFLVTEPATRSSNDRAQHLSKLVGDIRNGGRYAYHAALMLLGQDTRLALPSNTLQQTQPAPEIS